MKNAKRLTPVVRAALALSCSLLFGTPALGRDDAEDATLEGVWDVSVEIVDCSTGLPLPRPGFQGIIMFTRDGKVIDTAGNPLIPADPPGPPFTRTSPGLGTWRHDGGRHYSAVSKFFRMDGTVFKGTQELAESIELRGADNFVATGTSDSFDTNGGVIPRLHGCNQLVGTRLAE